MPPLSVRTETWLTVRGRAENRFRRRRKIRARFRSSVVRGCSTWSRSGSQPGRRRVVLNFLLGRNCIRNSGAILKFHIVYVVSNLLLTGLSYFRSKRGTGRDYRLYESYVFELLPEFLSSLPKRCDLLLSPLTDARHLVLEGLQTLLKKNDMIILP